MRKDDCLSNIGITVDITKFKQELAEDITEATFQANGTLLDLDDVIETAATATGISLDEAEIYEEELSPLTLVGNILPPANNDYYDDKKDKLIPSELHAYKHFKELQQNKLHAIKKQLTVNYFKPIERENVSIGAFPGISETEIVKTPELVLQIAVYKEQRMLKVKTVLVLASQTIADFVDAIDCPMDLAICWDENSQNPNLENVDWVRKTRDSSMIYLGDTIYIDKRSPNHIDYSEVIIKFLQLHADTLSRGQELIEKTAEMNKVKFVDLQLNIGLPYLFCHQGSCEHLIVIEQIRLFHPGDDPRIESYPKQTFRGGPRRTSCSICSDKFARWITYNDEEAPSSPCFFCFECFWCLHYSKNGEKLHDFCAYVYLESLEDRVGYQLALEKFKDGFISVQASLELKL